MCRIELIGQATQDIIRKAVEMDHAAFPPADWITEEDARLIYTNRPGCLIWLTEKDEPAGFATVFPISASLPAEAVAQGKPIYKLLTRESLADAKPGILYCHCFLLLPQCRGRGLICKLYEGLKMWLEENGGGYSTLYADAVSADGKRCLERLGFHAVHYLGAEGALYRSEKQDILDAIRAHQGMRSITGKMSGPVDS